METNECWITVRPNTQVNIMFPSPEDFSLPVVAHSLANKCRFSGFTIPFYSVAQHCVLVSYLCEPENALVALLHELDEVFLPDIPTPLKKLMPPEWHRVARDHHTTGCRAFGIPDTVPDDVHKADKVALCLEARAYLCPDLGFYLGEQFGFHIVVDDSVRLHPLTPRKAFMAFMGRAKELGVPL